MRLRREPEPSPDTIRALAAVDAALAGDRSTATTRTCAIWRLRYATSGRSRDPSSSSPSTCACTRGFRARTVPGSTRQRPRSGESCTLPVACARRRWRSGPPPRSSSSRRPYHDGSSRGRRRQGRVQPRPAPAEDPARSQPAPRGARRRRIRPRCRQPGAVPRLAAVQPTPGRRGARDAPPPGRALGGAGAVRSARPHRGRGRPRDPGCRPARRVRAQFVGVVRCAVRTPERPLTCASPPQGSTRPWRIFRRSPTCAPARRDRAT